MDRETHARAHIYTHTHTRTGVRPTYPICGECQESSGDHANTIPFQEAFATVGSFLTLPIASYALLETLHWLLDLDIISFIHNFSKGH